MCRKAKSLHLAPSASCFVKFTAHARTFAGTFEACLLEEERSDASGGEEGLLRGGRLRGGSNVQRDRLEMPRHPG